MSATPAWLPRGALLGTFWANGAAVPQARVQWQWTFFEQRTDALVVLLEGGGGVAALLPSTLLEGYDVPIRSLYEHTVMLGLGYRSPHRSGWEWGFQVTTGPMFYGARYRDLASEDRIAGLVEGRLQVGHTLGPMVLGLAVGYAEPYAYRQKSVARVFMGGFQVGLFADWR